MKIDFSDIKLLDEVAQQIIDFAGDHTVWLFFGEMGAGKTTLIKRIAEAIGVQDSVSSPTFALVNQYLTDTEEEVYHFDFYRIESEKEAEDLGIDEYFYSGNLCLIEWPEMIPNLLPDQYLKININFIGDKRTLDLTKYGPEDQRV